MEAIAKARGVSNMQVALAWVMKNPAITAPIVGTSKAHHLDDAVAALSLKLSDEEVKALEEPYKPKPGSRLTLCWALRGARSEVSSSGAVAATIADQDATAKVA